MAATRAVLAKISSAVKLPTCLAWSRVLTVVLGFFLAFGAGSAAAGETWHFIDGDGVLHMGGGKGTAERPDSSTEVVSQAVAEVPEFVAQRGLTWINQTWRLRVPVNIPSSLPVVRSRLSFAGDAAVRWPRGLDAARPVLEIAARSHAIDPALVIAVAAAESAFNPDAVSHKGALGLMQIMPATAARYGVVGEAPGGRHAVMEPGVNAHVGSRYLSDLLRMFGGDKSLALAAYNAGEGAVAKYGNRIPPYPETRQYVDKVMRYYKALTP